MARVYADVNQHMPKSYWEYDSVNITWGVLENYEVVRKIGKDTGTVIARHRLLLTVRRAREVLRSLRRNQHCQLPEMRYQSSKARQEEEDKAGNQDTAEFVGWAKCRCPIGCCARQPEQDTFLDF